MDAPTRIPPQPVTAPDQIDLAHVQFQVESSNLPYAALDPVLPLVNEDNVPDFMTQAKPVLQPCKLAEKLSNLGNREVLIDRKLQVNSSFPPTQAGS